MLSFTLAHGGDDTGFGILAFLPIGLILLVGFVLVLGPVLSGTPDRTDEPGQDEGR